MPIKSSMWVGMIAALLLVGCGGDPAPEAAAPATRPKSTAPTPQQLAANKQLQGMTSAVRTDTAPSPVNVKFELKARPELNKPLTVRLAFVAPGGLENLSASFAANQGLAVAATTPAEFTALEPGVPVFHEVSVTPKANGVQYMSAVVQVKVVDGQPSIQTYFIPVVVGPPPV